MSFFHVWICILGTIYVIDKLIDTMLNIVIYSDNKNENTPVTYSETVRIMAVREACLKASRQPGIWIEV